MTRKAHTDSLNLVALVYIIDILQVTLR